MRSYVLGVDKKNMAEHLHYSTYYPPELAELVLIRDRPLIERFGYVFEQTLRLTECQIQILLSPILGRSSIQ